MPFCQQLQFSHSHNISNMQSLTFYLRLDMVNRHKICYVQICAFDFLNFVSPIFKAKCYFSKLRVMSFHD